VKQITRKFKLNFLYSFQEYNDSHGANKYTWKTNIFVADMLYKWTPTISTRLELQYLQSKSDDKDWMAALAEVNFAPHWSIFVSDMYNYGRTDKNGEYKGTQKNYYSVGGSYTIQRVRIQLSYGRNRAGFICSGGVCRYSPEYNGINIALTASF
jgi:maltoporin